MPGFLGGSSGSGTGGEIRFPAEFIDPVTKLRVSEPQTLIDTDFEYGLQPTKWESVELINNTPSFFSKGGDTTIPNIASITTTELSREIKVTTSLAHGLAVGIPINVSGTKSLTADGAYIINSVPDSFTFTYLCRQNQPESASIEDLYSSIVTGEFFQGSQIKIADSDGLVTNGAGNSVLTVTTESPHGFGINTPFYFLNLNSTISQEFDSSNTNSKAFDASNSSTAQTFDGSNSLISYAVDLDNNAVLSGAVSQISTVSLVNNTITVSHTSENFVGKPVGTPLYHNVSSASGYFATTPRGVVFLKSLPTSTTNGSIFSVSLVPDGDVLPITSSVTGSFQLANAARTFAGNNIDASTQTTLTVIEEADIAFDGGNQGYAGAFASNGLSEVLGYTGTTSPFLVSTTAGAGLDYYVNAMLVYSSTGTAATGLVIGRTYFVASYATTATPNQYRITIKELPDSGTVLAPTGGTGTQTFNKIGVAPDKDIIHIPNSNFAEKDMIEYTFPSGGRFTASSVDETKVFYFVSKAYDSHNYQLNENLFSATAATGGVTATHTAFGITYRTHTFTTTGSNSFAVQSVGTIPTARFMMIGGGGSGGARHGGGGGAGGMIEGTLNLTATTYPISIGAGGTGKFADQQGNDGANTTFNSLTALGGGGGGSWENSQRNGRPGGSGGGGSEVGPGAGGATTQPGSASGGFGNVGGASQDAGTGHGSGGGGAGTAGTKVFTNFRSGPGGGGRTSTIYGRTYFFAGGGGGGSWEAGDPSTGGQGGAGGGGGGGQARSDFAGPGGGMTPNAGSPGIVGIPNSSGGDAGANSGGGGGGGGAYPPNTGYESTRGGNGGSGIVVIRYPLTPEVPITYTAATGGTITQATETGITYNVHTFNYTGALQSFTLTQVGTYPDIEIFAYGAGGGGGQPGGWSYGSTGGAGGFATARHAASLKTYGVVVGGAGANSEGTANGVSSNVFTFGGGAPSRPDTGDDRYGGQGGGLSGLFDNNIFNVANAILIAGGGGGGGSSRAEQGNMGGAGGGLAGQDGRSPYQGENYAGKGGTQSGGGALPTNGNSTQPTQLAGGITAGYGGGGGGGWWGGSAGAYVEPNTMGGGGGGSGYAHPTKATNPLFETGNYLYAPSTAFRSSDAVGRGGNVSSPGQNGQVVIRYPIAVAV
jgi:hypothetical protein